MPTAARRIRIPQNATAKNQTTDFGPRLIGVPAGTSGSGARRGARVEFLALFPGEGDPVEFAVRYRRVESLPVQWLPWPQVGEPVRLQTCTHPPIRVAARRFLPGSGPRSAYRAQ